MKGKRFPWYIKDNMTIIDTLYRFIITTALKNDLSFTSRVDMALRFEVAAHAGKKRVVCLMDLEDCM